jgi:hypothetical protein
VVGKRAVYDGSDPNWPTRKSANVGGDKPFVLEISFKLLFEPTNVIAAGDEVSEEEYVWTVLLNQLNYF